MKFGTKIIIGLVLLLIYLTNTSLTVIKSPISLNSESNRFTIIPFNSSVFKLVFLFKVSFSRKNLPGVLSFKSRVQRFYIGHMKHTCIIYILVKMNDGVFRCWINNSVVVSDRWNHVTLVVDESRLDLIFNRIIQDIVEIDRFKCALIPDSYTDINGLKIFEDVLQADQIMKEMKKESHEIIKSFNQRLFGWMGLCWIFRV